ncbi:MAG: hypothetical protein ABI970_03050 [Chloroflexota bacterium]
MPPKISEHHRWSAAYLREAAKEHDKAADLLDDDNEQEAGYHAYLAHGFETHALEESGHATKRSSDEVMDIDWDNLSSDEEKEPRPKHKVR